MTVHGYERVGRCGRGRLRWRPTTATGAAPCLFTGRLRRGLGLAGASRGAAPSLGIRGRLHGGTGGGTRTRAHLACGRGTGEFGPLRHSRRRHRHRRLRLLFLRTAVARNSSQPRHHRSLEPGSRRPRGQVAEGTIRFIPLCRRGWAKHLGLPNGIQVPRRTAPLSAATDGIFPLQTGEPREVRVG